MALPDYQARGGALGRLPSVTGSTGYYYAVGVVVAPTVEVGAYAWTLGAGQLIALGIGIAVALLGLVLPATRWLYDYAWFVGFFVSGAIYYALMRRNLGR